MKTTFLTLYLMSGDRLIEPVTDHECSAIAEAANATQVLGGMLSTDHEGQRELVVRIACGDADIVLALPASNGDCEVNV